MIIGRKIIVAGHYGSGKSEFSVSLAMNMQQADGFNIVEASPEMTQIAIIDLDIVNPYFRSREQRDMLVKHGIAVYGSVFNTEVTAELPALGANIRAPLEDKSCRVIIDVGGNDTGALILNQFHSYFTQHDTAVLAVINANRPETGTLDGILGHITSIESVSGLTVSYVVNNSHLLRETTADTIREGHMLCMDACAASGKQLLCDCYPLGIVDLSQLVGLSGNLMPLGLYLRPTWLDI